MNARDLVRAFSGLSVAVVGDSMLDVFLEGESSRLCPEGPVPVVDLTRREDAPGGAANAAANAAALGARTSLVSVVGTDPAAERLLGGLRSEGVDTSAVMRVQDRSTLCKTRVSADGHLLARLDEGDRGPVSPDAERNLVSALSEAVHSHDAVIVSDYRYGAMSPSVIAAMGDPQRRATIVVDTKEFSLYRCVSPDAVKPNFQQALDLLPPGDREGTDRTDLVAGNTRILLERTGARLVAVTLDRDGALFLETDRPPYRTYARKSGNGNPAGAGDTFTVTLALCLAAGADTNTAAELASTAAAVVMGSSRTASCTALQLARLLGTAEKHVARREDIAATAELYRRQGRSIVFTNGCFDILHRGHTAYLNRAKSLGDVLIVGLNTDDGVSRLKGPDRPVNPLADRIEILSALSCVDHIVPFSEDTPIELIRAIRPDVFVKGGDYVRNMLPEAPVVEESGGRVIIVPYEEDRSTTGLIERIRGQAKVPDR